jgi:cellulose biosynthesis protein BcsQ
MILSIINKKGGVGKTPISFSLAKDLGYYLQSNDNSVIESIYPDMAKITEHPSLIDNCIYDFGGFVDAGVLQIIKESDVVMIPCSIDFNSILRTVETIEEIQPHAKVGVWEKYGVLPPLFSIIVCPGIYCYSSCSISICPS